jgi:hypothetical protein
MQLILVLCAKLRCLFASATGHTVWPALSSLYTAILCRTGVGTGIGCGIVTLICRWAASQPFEAGFEDVPIV